MFDGSHYPIEENIEKTTELVKLCHGKGLSIEAEVGSIGGEEDGVVGMGECADPKECKMIADLGVDFLAAGIGNIHGKYPANWKDSALRLLQQFRSSQGELPLVLHGGTGIPDDMIKEKQLTLEFLRSMLIQNVSWYSQKLPANTLKQERILKEKDTIHVNFFETRCRCNR